MDERKMLPRQSAWDGCPKRLWQGTGMCTDVARSVTCGSHVPLGKGRYLPKASKGLWISRRIHLGRRMWATGQRWDFSGFPAVCGRTRSAGFPHTQLRANALSQAGEPEMDTREQGGRSLVHGVSTAVSLGSGALAARGMGGW